MRRNVNYRMAIGAAVIGATLAYAGEGLAGPITSTFDSDDEGWIGNPGQGAVAFQATGGNPDGHIRVTDIGAGPAPSGAVAPAKFLGDLSAFDGGTLTFDMATFAGGGGTFASFGTVEITSGGGDMASFDVAASAPPFGVWVSYLAPLNAADWGKTDLEWMAILADVTNIVIFTDAFDGPDTIGIDNVKLNMPMVGVPIPATLSFLAIGLAGLGFASRRRA